MEQNSNIDVSYQYLLQRLKDNQPFTFMRFGNGEFDCLMNDTGRTHNKNGCTYFPDLGKKLREIISSPIPYYIGLQNMVQRQRPNIKELFPQNYINGDILHYASIKMEFKPFIEELKKHKTLLIANKTLAILGFEIYQIPQRDSWKTYDTIKRFSIKFAAKFDIICVCGGLAGKVLINDLYNEFKDTKTIIDMGSVLDPYAGIVSRKYHKKIINKL